REGGVERLRNAAEMDAHVGPGRRPGRQLRQRDLGMDGQPVGDIFVHWTRSAGDAPRTGKIAASARMIHRLRTLLTLDPATRGRLLEATVLFHLARGALRVVPFRRLAPLLGRTDGAPAT